MEGAVDLSRPWLTPGQALRELRDVVMSLPREMRRTAVRTIDAALEQRLVTEREARDLLTDWDVRHFPDQVPDPVRKRSRSRAMHRVMMQMLDSADPAQA